MARQSDDICVPLILLRIIHFGRLFISFGESGSKAVTDVLFSVSIHQRRLFSDKPVLRTLALCCRDVV